jgi:hypothetical protein
MQGLTIQWRRDTTARWEEINPVLRMGEPGLDVDTGYFALGDGRTRWKDLPKFLPDASLQDFIRELIHQMPTGEVTQQDLEDHINAEEPHPVYDSMPSLSSYYQSRKGQP